jgi:hypothetical protein
MVRGYGLGGKSALVSSLFVIGHTAPDIYIYIHICVYICICMMRIKSGYMNINMDG